MCSSRGVSLGQVSACACPAPPPHRSVPAWVPAGPGHRAHKGHQRAAPARVAAVSPRSRRGWGGGVPGSNTRPSVLFTPLASPWGPTVAHATCAATTPLCTVGRSFSGKLDGGGSPWQNYVLMIQSPVLDDAGPAQSVTQWECTVGQGTLRRDTDKPNVGHPRGRWGPCPGDLTGQIGGKTGGKGGGGAGGTEKRGGKGGLNGEIGGNWPTSTPTSAPFLKGTPGHLVIGNSPACDPTCAVTLAGGDERDFDVPKILTLQKEPAIACTK